jgi:ribonuclease III
LRLVPNIILQYFVKDSRVALLQNMLGFTPSNIALYELALIHRSNNIAEDSNNERLEFLGDAILGAIVGEYLYKKYPKQPEGFLTEMRSKIVNRATLNSIAIKIGLKQIVKFNRNDMHLRSSQIFGNALEALIGAIYVDKGFAKTKQFIQQHIIKIYIDLDALELEDANLKNKLIGWANKQKKQIEFTVLHETIDGKRRTFDIGILLDGELICQAGAPNKKEASKRAAKLAIEQLDIV